MVSRKLNVCVSALTAGFFLFSPIAEAAAGSIDAVDPVEKASLVDNSSGADKSLLGLSGEISNDQLNIDSEIPKKDDADRFVLLWDRLMSSCHQSAECQRYDRAVDRYALKRMYLKARANDALNSVFMFKGVSISSEAGDVILDEKLKIDSLGAAKYARQKHNDEIELRAMQSLLQVASSMGQKESTEQHKQLAKARDVLAGIAGDDAADHAITSLKEMCEKSSNKKRVAADWDITSTQERIDKAIHAAALRDPFVEDVNKDVHKYNAHSPVTMAAHRMVRVALSVSSLAPNMIGPASQAVLFGYVVLSGGSEQSKLLKELYMEKRLANRARTLDQETQLAFHQYQLGSATNNAPLTACAEMLIARMIGKNTAEELLHDNFAGAEGEFEAEAKPATHPAGTEL
jgi:hypothetical protein